MREQQNYRAAIYCRLSSEDGADHESMSIGNQRALLAEYVQKKAGRLLTPISTTDSQVQISTVPAFSG
ncbi:hypothetical protein [Enterococcus faecium]|uniref:hypothetical protein n=1 Tax=Enterococcus faecium TaxID=1352 RepID=UPI00211A67E1|nr:hypothetical protein [Enterococcus faecium]